MNGLEILAFAIGLLSVVCCFFLAKAIINKGEKNTGFLWPLSKAEWIKLLTFGILGGIYFFFISKCNLNFALSAMLCFIFFISLLITLVDMSIRMIPNYLIAVLLIGALAAYFSHLLKDNIGKLLIGFFISLIVFAIPFYLSNGIGGGDVKLAASIGFWIGFPDIAVAFIVMGISIMAYALYLKLSNKGGLKSEIALGPFLALGMVITMTLKTINFY